MKACTVSGYYALVSHLHCSTAFILRALSSLLVSALYYFTLCSVGCCFHQLHLIRSCIKSIPFEAVRVAMATFCHFKSGTLQQPAGLRVSWTDSSRFSMLPLIFNRTYDYIMPLPCDVLHWLPAPFRSVCL